MERAQRSLPVRVGLVAAGSLLVLVGIVGLFLPLLPGWLLIIPGLVVLAGEFVWAQRLLDSARRRLAVLTGDQS